MPALFSHDQLHWIVSNKPYPQPWKGDKLTGGVPYKDNKVLHPVNPPYDPWTRGRFEREMHDGLKDKVMASYDAENSTNKRYSATMDLYTLLDNPPPPVVNTGRSIKFGYGTSADTLFVTKDWYCVLSPTPFMAQLHLLLWSRNSDAKNAMKMGSLGMKRLDVGIASVREFLKSKTDIDDNVSVQFGFHFPPTIPRLHAHVLVGRITDMGADETNANKWISVGDVKSLEESFNI
jgi:hypothetical protein